MMRKWWKGVGLAVAVVTLGTAFAWTRASDEDRQERERATGGGGEWERKVTQADVPKPALTTLRKLAGDARITAFSEEVEHGHTFYEGSWKAASGANVDALVTPTGDLVEIEERVGADRVPAAVRKAAQKAAGDDASVSFEKKTMVLYEAKFRKAGRRHELLLSPDGRRVEEEVDRQGQEEEDDS